MFYNNDDFEFIPALEENWLDIRNEFLALNGEDLTSWHQTDMYKNNWHVFELNFFGRENEANTAKCPKTMAVLDEVPGLSLATFSKLGAHSHIEPHVGITDDVLRCHLGLIVPPKCYLRVGDETMEWQEGKAFVFSDMLEHEAKNESDMDRVVLMLDFIKE